MTKKIVRKKPPRTKKRAAKPARTEPTPDLAEHFVRQATTLAIDLVCAVERRERAGATSQSALPKAAAVMSHLLLAVEQYDRRRGREVQS